MILRKTSKSDLGSNLATFPQKVPSSDQPETTEPVWVLGETGPSRHLLMPAGPAAAVLIRSESPESVDRQQGWVVPSEGAGSVPVKFAEQLRAVRAVRYLSARGAAPTRLRAGKLARAWRLQPRSPSGPSWPSFAGFQRRLRRR